MDAQTLTDGDYDYVLVRPSKDNGPGVASDLALYERVPVDPLHYYTPDLKFLTGINQVPEMIPLDKAPGDTVQGGSDATTGTADPSAPTSTGTASGLGLVLLIGLGLFILAS